MRHSYLRIMRVRDAVLMPLTRLWAALGVTPNTLSGAGVLVMAGFAATAKNSPSWAVFMLVLAMLLDLNDGALARYLKVDNDRGKFTDMVCDSLVYTLFVVGMLHAGLLTPAAGLLLAYFMLLSKVMRSIWNASFLQTDWRFKTVAGFVPNCVVGVTYAIFFINIATGYNALRHVAWPLIGWLVIDGYVFYARILANGCVTDTKPADTAPSKD